MLYVFCVVRSEIPAESQPFVVKHRLVYSVHRHIVSRFDIQLEYRYDFVRDLYKSFEFAFGGRRRDKLLYARGVVLVELLAFGVKIS